MAKTTIGKAYVQIVPSALGISDSIAKEIDAGSVGSKAGSDFASSMGSMIKGSAAVITGAVAAVTGAAVGAGKAIWDSAKSVAEYGDNIDKMSQKMGMSAQAYQEWDFIAQHSGTSMESLKTSFKTMANAAQDGKEEFQALLQRKIAELSKQEQPKAKSFEKGWKDLYETLTEENKRSFWRSLIKEVKVDENGQPIKILY